MRGTEKKQATMLTLLSPERCVPQKHPLRAVKALADAALRELSPGVRRDVQRDRAALNPAGASAEVHAPDGILLGAQRDALLHALTHPARELIRPNKPRRCPGRMARSG